jgi:hypothetical protein
MLEQVADDLLGGELGELNVDREHRVVEDELVPPDIVIDHLDDLHRVVPDPIRHRDALHNP